MIAAGNSVVFNVHPECQGVSVRLVGSLLNEAIGRRRGRRNLLCAVANPTIESAGTLMKHPGGGAPGGDRRTRGGESCHGEREEGHLRRAGQSALRRG
jgi:hypothetical protein